MRLLWRFLKTYAAPHWPWYLLGVVTLYGTNQLTVLVPHFVKDALDALGRGDGEASLVQVGYIMASAVLIVVIRATSRLCFFNPGRAAEFRFKNHLFHHLIQLPQSFHDRSRVGDLMSRATNDLQNVRALIGFAGLQILEAAFIIPLTFQQMLALSPELTQSTSVLVLLAVGVMYAGTSAVVRLMREGLEQLSLLSEQILDTFSAIPVVQGFCAQPAFLARFDACNEAYIRITLRMSAIRSFVIPLVTLLGGVAAGLVLWKGGQAVLAGSLTIGALVAFSSLIAILMTRMMSFGWTLSVIQRGIVALERIYELLDVDPGLPEATRSLPSPRPATRLSSPVPAAISARAPESASSEQPAESLQSGFGLEVRDLTFTYPGSEARGPSLKDLSFSLEPGQTLGVFGHTGSGKSTLVHLLARVYTPPPGTIFLNGIDLRELPLKELREIVALVPQDPFLFSTTLRENIRWGGSASSGGASSGSASSGSASAPSDQADTPAVVSTEDARLQLSIRLACLESDLQALNLGLETVVGARGITLSGGQRQRSALARALYRDFSILLLDDVLAAVDHKTERALIRNIYSHSSSQQGRAQTTVIISHRISALQHADLILVLEDGSITDRGTHAELIARPGPYSETWQAQQQSQQQTQPVRGEEEAYG